MIPFKLLLCISGIRFYGSGPILFVNLWPFVNLENRYGKLSWSIREYFLKKTNVLIFELSDSYFVHHLWSFSIFLHTWLRNQFYFFLCFHLYLSCPFHNLLYWYHFFFPDSAREDAWFSWCSCSLYCEL